MADKLHSTSVIRKDKHCRKCALPFALLKSDKWTSREWEEWKLSGVCPCGGWV